MPEFALETSSAFVPAASPDLLLRQEKQALHDYLLYLPRPQTVHSDPTPANQSTFDSVFSMIAEANQSGNCNEATDLYGHAIETADRSGDVVLRALARIEKGLALMELGCNEQGFAWILEAGSINSGIYDSKVNQSFLHYMEEIGMPMQTLDLLMCKGAQNPNWYLTESNAAGILDLSMNSGAHAKCYELSFEIEDLEEEGESESVEPQTAGLDVIMLRDLALDCLAQAVEKQKDDRQKAFRYFREAFSLADQTGEKDLQASVRLELGLALLSSWGNVELGFRWLLHAGSINSELFNTNTNSEFAERLLKAGITEAAFNNLIDMRKKDPYGYSLSASLLLK